MSCTCCQSKNQNTFPCEINIHFPRPNKLTKPSVWAFPEIVICLDCGFAEFRIEERELRLLEDGTAVEAA
jgi:hypothetical protein